MIHHNSMGFGVFLCVKGKHLVTPHSQVWQKCLSAHQCKPSSPSPQSPGAWPRYILVSRPGCTSPLSFQHHTSQLHLSPQSTYSNFPSREALPEPISSGTIISQHRLLAGWLTGLGRSSGSFC